MVRNNVTRIPVLVSTRELLRKVGSKAETYDDIIRRLLKNAGH